MFRFYAICTCEQTYTYISLASIYMYLDAYKSLSICTAKRPWLSIWQALANIFYSKYLRAWHVIILNVLAVENTWETFAICVIFVHFFFPNLLFLYCVLARTQLLLPPHLHRRRITRAQCIPRHPIVFASAENLMCALFLKTMTQIHRIYSEQ